MKKAIIFPMLALTAMASAQVRKGTIVYERTMDMHRRITDEQIKAMVPRYNTTQMQLLFDDSISLYRALPRDEAPDPFENNGGRTVFIRGIGGANSQLFRNTSSMMVTEYSELADKPYLIRDTIHQMPWKLTEETKTILGMPCKRAEMVNARGLTVSAWYTDRIAGSFGPESYGSLPGTVLEVDVNQGETLITARSISPDADMKILREPSRGKSISRADFSKKAQELFGAPQGGGNGPVIRFNTRN